MDLVVARRAPWAEAQPGDDLVHYHADAVIVADAAHAADKCGAEYRAAHVEADGFDDYGGDLVPVLPDQALDCF